MHVWKFGCGITLLGVVLTLGSCGLFGLAVNRQLEQRQIATLDLRLAGGTRVAETTVDEPGRVRVEFRAVVRPTERDYVAADSSATIASAQLAVAYRIFDAEGSILARGAGELSGSEIIPEASRRGRSDMGREIDLLYRSEPFEVELAGPLRLEVETADRDEAGRELLRAEALVYDRVGRNAGSLAAGGLLSLLVGPFVFGVGLIVFLIGLFTRKNNQARGAQSA